MENATRVDLFPTLGKHSACFTTRSTELIKLFINLRNTLIYILLRIIYIHIYMFICMQTLKTIFFAKFPQFRYHARTIIPMHCSNHGFDCTQYNWNISIGVHAIIVNSNIETIDVIFICRYIYLYTI